MTLEGSAASSTAGARSSRPAWCAPSLGPRAPRPTSTSSVSAQPGLQLGATLFRHSCSFQYAPGRWEWHGTEDAHLHPLDWRSSPWVPHLHPSLCRGCFPPAHPGPPEPPHLRPLHSLQVSRALAGPCIGQSSPPSPSPVLPHGEPWEGEGRDQHPGGRGMATSRFTAFPAASSPARLPTHPPDLASARPAVPQAGLAVPKGFLSPPGCRAQLWG